MVAVRLPRSHKNITGVKLRIALWALNGGVRRGNLLLVEELEGALLRLVARGNQALDGLLAGRHLLAADDATVLVHHQVGLGETARGVLGRAVVDLGLRARGDHGTTAHLDVVLARVGAAGVLAILARVGRHFLPKEEIFFRGCQRTPCRSCAARKDFCE